ncbi:hypothetical protein ACFE04_019614 [Oxalis oulophora]
MINRSTRSKTILQLLPLKWQRVFEHSRIIKYYRLLRRFNKRVFLLGKHGNLICKKLVPFLFVGTVSSLLYLLCLKMNLVYYFWPLLSRIGFSMGSRALAFFVSRCFPLEGGMALAILFLARVLITAEASEIVGLRMMATEANSVNSGSERAMILERRTSDPAPDESVPPMDPQAVEDENLRLRQENAELRRLLREEKERVKAVVDETEDQIERAREEDRRRDRERAAATEELIRDYSKIKNHTSIIRIENNRLKYRINELLFRNDQQRFRRE